MSETRRNQSNHERIDNSEIQHRRVEIENSHGEKLVGVLHDTGSTETVVICHGIQSSKGDQVEIARVIKEEVKRELKKSLEEAQHSLHIVAGPKLALVIDGKYSGAFGAKLVITYPMSKWYGGNASCDG